MPDLEKFIGNKEIAEMTGLSKPTVTNLIKKIKETYDLEDVLPCKTKLPLSVVQHYLRVRKIKRKDVSADQA